MEEFLKQWLFNPIVGRLVAALVGVLIVGAVVRLVQRSLSRYLKDADSRYKARKFVLFLGYVAAILVIGAVFSDKLGGLNIALGVAGAGIAFALQEVIASLAGWVAISFSNFYRTGDRVQLGGTKGDVIDIGMLRTTIMEVGEWVKGDLYNGRVVRVANSFVFKEPVYNYSGEFPFLWDEITIPVKYGSDYRKARELLEIIVRELVGEYAEHAKLAWKELVKKYLIEDAKVEPTVTMTADENWMTFTIRYVMDYKLRRTTKDRLFTRIIEEFEKTEGRVAIASTSSEITLVRPTVKDKRD